MNVTEIEKNSVSQFYNIRINSEFHTKSRLCWEMSCRRTGKCHRQDKKTLKFNLDLSSPYDSGK